MTPEPLWDDPAALWQTQGEEAPVSLEQVAGMAPDGVELECSEGGQPHWWWLLSAE